MSILVSRVCSCFTFTLIAHPAMVLLPGPPTHAQSTDDWCHSYGRGHVVRIPAPGADANP